MTEYRIFPPYLRRAKSIDEAILYMYIYSIAANGTGDSLKAMLGPSIGHLSPNNPHGPTKNLCVRVGMAQANAEDMETGGR